jgi:hypothetical protein
MKHLGSLGLAVLCAAAVLAGAASPGEAKVIYGCRKIVGGTLRIVGGTGRCLATEREVSWNSVGPQGPQGPQGEPGISGLAGKQCPVGYYLRGFDPDGNLVCVDIEAPLPTPPGWCNTQFPPSLATLPGVPTALIYGQVWMDGVTPTDGPQASMTAEVGVGADGTDPATHPSWQWFPAAYNAQVGNNDEYSASLTLAAPGTYDYCFRFSNAGSRFVYGDLDGSPYSPAQAGSLVVGTPSCGDGICDPGEDHLTCAADCP